jgi:hypothetical protein
VRDPNFQRPRERGEDNGVDLAAGEELESRAEGSTIDEYPDELLHPWFRIFDELGLPAADLLQGRQREFRSDRLPCLIIDPSGRHS